MLKGAKRGPHCLLLTNALWPRDIDKSTSMLNEGLAKAADSNSRRSTRQPKGQPPTSTCLARITLSPNSMGCQKKANSNATAGKQEAQAKRERRVCQLFSAFWNLTRTAILHTSRSVVGQLSCRQKQGAHLFLLLQLADTVTRQHGLSKDNNSHKLRKMGGEGAHLFLLLQLAHESATNGSWAHNAHC